MKYLDLPDLVKVVAERASSFLAEEVGIEVSGVEYHLKDVQKLDLGYLTSLMSVEGKMKLYLALSFDQPLIEQAFAAYTADLDIAADERDRYIEETAADMVNIIVGNATTFFSAPDRTAVSLSPPIIITEGKSIFRYKDARFFSATLHTTYGCLYVLCIGPKDLFDERLTYL